MSLARVAALLEEAARLLRAAAGESTITEEETPCPERLALARAPARRAVGEYLDRAVAGKAIVKAVG